MSLTYDTQFFLSAIVRNLVETGGNDFDGEAAASLRHNLPITPKRNFQFRASIARMFKGGSFEGMSNTGHQISGDGDDKPHTFSYEPKKVWLGNYAVRREEDGDKAFVWIEDRFEDTREINDGDPVSWVLEFRFGLPVVLKAYIPKTYRLGILHIIRAKAMDWKFPRRAS